MDAGLDDTILATQVLMSAWRIQYILLRIAQFLDMAAGLDNAILGYLNADERKVDAKRIAQLLAHGAHALQAPDEEATKEGEAFAEEVRQSQHHCTGPPPVYLGNMWLRSEIVLAAVPDVNAKLICCKIGSPGCLDWQQSCPCNCCTCC